MVSKCIHLDQGKERGHTLIDFAYILNGQPNGQTLETCSASHF